MRTRTLGMMLLLIQTTLVQSQSKSPVDQALEGGKVLVELIKVFGNDKHKEGETGCNGRYANLCIVNARDSSLTILLTHHDREDRCELIITPDGKECCLQLALGVWTYTISAKGNPAAIRKGDLLVEACNDLTMTLK